MDIQKGNKINIIIVVLILILTFFSCDSTISNMENILGMKLNGKVSLLKKEEKWIKLNGNGHKIMIYSIKDSCLIPIIKRSQGNKFNYYKADSLDGCFNPFLFSFIGHSSGYYKTIENENVIQTIVIDSSHCQLIYFLLIR